MKDPIITEPILILESRWSFDMTGTGFASAGVGTSDVDPKRVSGQPV